MCQSDKINKALKIIYKSLPSTYPKVGVKIYKTCYSMLRAEANYNTKAYKKHCQWYNKYFKAHDNSKENYIETKYYKRKRAKDHKKDYLNITAISGNPIDINIENTIYHTLKNYIFLLLHEIGHHYYKPKGKQYNEHLCDEFAIRWFKRIIL